MNNLFPKGHRQGLGKRVEETVGSVHEAEE